MSLSRGKKIALLVATLWPVLYLLLFMIVWFGMFMSIMSRSAGSFPDLDRLFFAIVPLHLFTMVESLVLTVIYALLAWKHVDGDETQRLIWVLLVVMTGFVGQAIFWFVKIRPEPTGEAPS